MLKTRLFCCGLLVALSIAGSALTFGQAGDTEQFGPVVRAYLGYLRNEQEVVDDRASRHEVTPQYYRKNSNRIRALRQIAVQIARETENDYLPELEAVTADELGLLFEHPPRSQSLKVGEVVQTTFKYLGVVRSGDLFYVFARLDPYQQAEMMERVNQNRESAIAVPISTSPSATKVSTRARRVSTP